MRNIRHHALVVTCNDRTVLESVRAKALELYKIHMESSKGAQLVSEIKESLINHYGTFFIIPDGSKEGYDASDDNDIIRDRLIDFIKTLIPSTAYHLSYAEVSFGADDATSVVRHG